MKRWSCSRLEAQTLSVVIDKGSIYLKQLIKQHFINQYTHYPPSTCLNPDKSHLVASANS